MEAAVPQIGGGLVMLVPLASLTAWRRAAIDCGETIEDWLARMLIPLPSGRVLWEAAAAERGETLAEWVLAQMARPLPEPR